MKRILLLICMMIFLTGCSSVVPSEYITIKPHAGNSAQTDREDAVIVSNYQEMKNAILGFVRECRTEGMIRVNSYDGDVEADLAEAAYEVSRVEPLGVYAVDYMTHECTRIVSYYDIHIRTTYRRTAKEIAQIETIGTQTRLQSRLEEAVNEGERRVVLRMTSYREQDIPAMVAEYCAEHRDTVIEAPTVGVTVCPQSGPTRIVEIDFRYTQTQEALREMRQMVQENIRGAAAYIRYRGTERGKAELLYTYLTTRFVYVEQDTATPLYSALCAGVADPAGLAYAWQLICEQADVSCHVVNGMRDGEPWVWNIVSVDGYYRHLDLVDSIMEQEALLLLTDEEMSRYYWNTAQYPLCEPIPIQQPADQPEPEQPDGMEETNSQEQVPTEEQPQVTE